jgi:hypothetical protein
MSHIERFRYWAEKCRRKEGIICHFYYADKERNRDGKNKKAKQKQYYTKVDYAHFNLFSDSQDWLVKGTPEHGISGLTSRGYEKSQVPCLNCYEIDGKFYRALGAPEEQWNKRYELGIIFSKQRLKVHFGENKVKDVELWNHKNQRPPPRLCWFYDIGKGRVGPLRPFNRCHVVRVRIPKSRTLGIAIKPMPREAIRGIIVKRGTCEIIRKLLEVKGWDDIKVFPLL